GYRVDQGRKDIARGAALDEGTRAAVVGEERQTVAGAGGQRRQQQGRVHGRVQPGYVPDPARGRAAGVEDQQDVTVPLGTPGADRDRRLTGRGAPVDGTGVVAGDVLAQAVELGALTPRQDAGAAVEFPQTGQLRRQVL